MSCATQRGRSWRTQLALWKMQLQATSKGNLAQHKRTVHERMTFPCSQCNHQATSKGDLAQHKRALYEEVKYPCEKCNYHATSKGNLLLNTKGQYMKEWNTIVCDAANNFPRREVLEDTIGLYMEANKHWKYKLWVTLLLFKYGLGMFSFSSKLKVIIHFQVHFCLCCIKKQFGLKYDIQFFVW